MKENNIEIRNEVKFSVKKENSDFNNSSIYDKTSMFDGLQNEINDQRKRGNTQNNRFIQN